MVEEEAEEVVEEAVVEEAVVEVRESSEERDDRLESRRGQAINDAP